MHEVAEIRLSDRTFQRVLFHRNNRIYRFLIDVCRLLHSHLIPNERTDRYRFRNFVRDERRMRVLFERFIRNFYRRHAEGYTSIQSEPIRWEHSTASLDDRALLPQMRTDVTLRRPGLVIVVDAKYYRQTLQEYRGHEAIRSGHLYQLFAYLKNVAIATTPNDQVEGVLIYPLTFWHFYRATADFIDSSLLRPRVFAVFSPACDHLLRRDDLFQQCGREKRLSKAAHLSGLRRGPTGQASPRFRW